MKQISIIKNQVITHQAKFETEAEAIAWLESQKIVNAFGKNERWVLERDLEAQGENAELAIATELVVLPGGDEVTRYKFAAEYTHAISDVTLQSGFEKKINERRAKRQFGEYIIDKIAYINESKIGTEDDVDAFMSVPAIIKMREHLKAGNIDTFLSVLFKTDVSAFFTLQEKEALTIECRAFLNSLD